jgi:ankyrin repeat protein
MANAKKICKKIPLKHIEIAQELLGRGADVNAKGKLVTVKNYGAVESETGISDVTPLLMAADADDDAMVRFLLDRRANPSLKTSLGQYPESFAKDAAIRRLINARKQNSSCCVLQ